MAAVRAALLERREIALFDLREEAVFAEAHPLFAASLPLGRLEIEIYDRVPRRDTEIVVYDAGEGLVEPALLRLGALGYTRVAALDGGLDGWRAAGGEIFKDVNVPSKAFGELVESRRHTPSLAAAEVEALIDSGADIAILDARPFEEYSVMSIPTAVNVPGGELAYRVRDLVPRPETTIIVNCAGRTRSIMGTQSLINAGIPNKVAALRNGTIGWTLAGLSLETGQGRRSPAVRPEHNAVVRETARDLARRAGVRPIGRAEFERLAAETGRTLYRFDVRDPAEYEAGHLPGFRSAPGGQLVQETDVFAPVRGARIVLTDDDGVRARMTGSWLAQMGWEVLLLDGEAGALVETGPWHPTLPPLPPAVPVDVATLRDEIESGASLVLDLAPSAAHRKGHVPGAWQASRDALPTALARLPAFDRLVLTSPDGVLAQFAAAEASAESGRPVRVLAGGTAAWQAAGLPLETGLARPAVPPADRYRRPYEGTDNPRDAMQAYLDWEFGLVAQLDRDGTHGFFVL